MTPLLKEAMSGLKGAWRLVLSDSQAMLWFNVSIEGFWRSFFAAALAAPFYALMVALEYSADPMYGGFPRLALVEMLTYGLSWIALPVTAIALCKILKLTQTYIPYIIASNWATVLQTMLYFLFYALAFRTAGSADVETAFNWVLVALISYYLWVIARITLQASRSVAVLFVVLQFALVTGINVLGNSLV